MLSSKASRSNTKIIRSTYLLLICHSYCSSCGLFAASAFVLVPRHRETPSQLLSWTRIHRRLSPSSKRRQQQTDDAVAAVEWTRDNTEIMFVTPDYMVYDTIQTLDGHVLLTFLRRPREILAVLLLMCGVAVTGWNIVGNYDDSYQTLEIAVFGFAVINGLADIWDCIQSSRRLAAAHNESLSSSSSSSPLQQQQLLVVDPRIHVSPNVRCGVVDDAVLHAYSGFYTLATVWLGFRTSPLCSSVVPWLPSLDPVLGPLAASIFLFSLLAPTFTLIHHFSNSNDDDEGSDDGPVADILRNLVALARQRSSLLSKETYQVPTLSETELLRATSLLAIGVIGCIYTPMVVSLAIKGVDWWPHVCDAFPGQSIVEPSTAMFGILATQASMLSHRSGKAGAAPVKDIVPAFTVVCFVLAILPCACLLYWLSEQITFFELYSM